MKMKLSIIAVLVLGLVVSAGAGVVYDDFEDGTIDPAWTITSETVQPGGETPTFTLGESGGSLTLSALASSSTGDSHKWTNVYATQSFDAVVGDFHLEFQQSWSETQTSQMPHFYVSLLATSSVSQVVARVGIQDNSDSDYGVANIYNQTDGQTNAESLAQSGTLVWKVDRVDGLITVKLNDSVVDSFTDTRDVIALALLWQGRTIDNWTWSPETLTMSADMVNFVPEPATLAMLGFGSIMMMLRRKK